MEIQNCWRENCGIILNALHLSGMHLPTRSLGGDADAITGAHHARWTVAVTTARVHRVATAQNAYNLAQECCCPVHPPLKSGSFNGLLGILHVKWES